MTRSDQLVCAVHQAQFPHLDSLIHPFVGGSELHGAKVKKTDDLDIHGVYSEPPELSRSGQAGFFCALNRCPERRSSFVSLERPRHFQVELRVAITHFTAATASISIIKSSRTNAVTPTSVLAGGCSAEK